MMSIRCCLLLCLVRASHGLASMPPLAKTADHLPLAHEAMKFFDASPDPYHAVATCVDRLQAAGFKEIEQPYNIVPGGKYYFTADKSSLVAFSVGLKYAAGNGIKIIGGHTDSPNLRVKPRSKRVKDGCIQIGVECYGGGLWHTWFDRDLGLSGQVLVRTSNEKITSRLVKIDRALLRISNLAIHLTPADERKAFKFNNEDHLSPILALEAKKALEGKKEDTDDDKNKDGWTEHQEPALLQLLAVELDVDVKDIVDFDLSLFDISKATVGGVFSEFLHSARLDNLASCFLALQALLDHPIEDDEDISMICLYDHEEVGSSSAVGAAGPILRDTITRITKGDPELYAACIQKSFCISSDQAHALHPNYSSKHEANHQPKMNQGMVIKRNSNQRYATNLVTGLLIREVARRANLPAPQEFIVRQDCGCGSTIGPLISTATGIRTIDMGCPQLSMHSIRETMGICDVTNGLALFTAFFRYFSTVDQSLEQ
jgi:aspartyl aminopeptidase